VSLQPPSLNTRISLREPSRFFQHTKDVGIFPSDEGGIRIATKRGDFTILSKHVRHERFRRLPRSAAGSVVIEVLPVHKSAFRIEPVVPEIAPLFEVIETLN